MAIKTISQLDQFNNGDTTSGVWNVGGKLCAYKDNNVKNPKSDEADASSHGATLIESDDNFSYSLIEISQPQITNLERRTPGKSNEYYYSKHVRYIDLLKNIAADVKKYLNAHNGLFNNDVETIAHDNYTFTGHKIFLPSNDQQFGAGICVKRDQNDGFALSVSGNTNLDGNARISDNLEVYGGMSAYSDFVVDRSLTADQNKVYVGKQLSVGDNMYVFLSTNFHDNVLIEKNLSVEDSIKVNNLYGENGHFNNNIICQKLTSEIELSCPSVSSVTITSKNGYFKGDLSCSGLTCTAQTAYLTALKARWADLAECYLADKDYEPGTLVKFGGDNEITIADNEVNAVISTKPAILMNSSEDDGNPMIKAIALIGRVPVKVIGKIKKFDKIVLSDIPGIAIAQNSQNQIPIGRALQGSDIEDIKLVECIIKIEL